MTVTVPGKKKGKRTGRGDEELTKKKKMFNKRET